MRKYCADRGSIKRFLNPGSRGLWLAAVLMLMSAFAAAHNMSGANARFVEGLDGPAVIPYMYLGAKHMVTGYDHLLYLLGVVFFLRRLKDVLIYVSLFTLGHSLTLMGGVLLEWNVNAYLIDTIIGLSVAYKAFENMNGFKQIFRCQLNAKAAVLIFGLFHGLGLATKLQDLSLSTDSLVVNMLSFNVGVEIGQALALACIVVILGQWRQRSSFQQQAFAANTVLMSLGFMLAGYQFCAYLWA
ncbi:MAG: HupE/UreJ family protein [Gammaproteobacteria bacterium]|nr:HupE/UreJ family protein [Gammaproteobacteria bacterium]MBQ0840549.1 HupE/UreJ family protein [Gammaproteobacteria bacterium]